MHTTPVSLLDRLRTSPSEEDWRRLVHLYTPLLFAWAQRAGASEHEAADIAQDVFTVLIRMMPTFVYDDKNRFRGWLRTVAINKFRSQKRREAKMSVQALADDDALPDQAIEFWQREYHREVVARALRLMQADFSDTTWKACWMFVAEGRSAADVGRELGISENAVYLAKRYVLRRLRQELGGLVE